MDSSGDGNKCVLDGLFTLIYTLEVLPQSPERLGEEYHSGTWDNEPNNWFMQLPSIGDNQPILNKFISFAEANDKRDDICLLIDLIRYNKSNADDFHLNLLKQGRIIIEGYELPGRILTAEVEERGWNFMDIKVLHTSSSSENANLVEELKVTLSLEGNKDVSCFSTKKLDLIMSNHCILLCYE